MNCWRVATKTGRQKTEGNRNAFKSRLKCPNLTSGAVRRVDFQILVRDRETPVTKSSVCSRNSEDVGMIGAK